MNKAILKKLSMTVLAVCVACALCACSRIADIRLPPLPTPSAAEPGPTEDVFAPDQGTVPSFPTPPAQTPAVPTPPALVTPEPTVMTTPEPTPIPLPTPTPFHEDPNIPHLFIEGATYPQNMGQYGVVDLYGNITTDKGVIAMVWGRILDADGVIVQNCKYYPYTDSFSLAGTVNAELHFAVLEPGHYAYVVSAIAENNSYSSGETVLIEHPFEIYYP